MDKCLVRIENRDGTQLLKLKRLEWRARLEANKDSEVSLAAWYPGKTV